MTRAYSMDLRERVTKAVASGLRVRTVALQFGVAPSTVVKWIKRLKTTGSAAPGKMGGHRRPIISGEAKTWLTERVAAKPDLTIRALHAELRERGVEVGHNAVWLCLRKEGLSFKKKSFTQRTGSPEGCPASGEVEGPSG